ncbi:MAG TPA: HNH endonuclease [Ktedonobacteraceae bacterium]|nr:HNH endonuclease [Ktedonobacteraceae bacterium]
MKHVLSALAIIAVLSLLLCGCDVTITSSGSATATPSSGATHFGVQTKTSGCQAHGGLPDSACTPGAIFPNATAQEICKSGYASSVRNVPTSEKDQAYAEYGITHHSSGQYEVDHLVSLELGGSNDIANLWPEAASPTPGFHQKDQVENYLHNQVCSGAISLKEAQIEIATNWLAVYQRMPH